MKYTELFIVEILHDYYSAAKARGLRLEPTSACLQVLHNNGLSWKFYENKLYIISRTGDGLKPFTALQQETLFSFWLSQDSAEPMATANLPIAQNQIYYFNNLNDEVVSGKRYIHARQDNFIAGNTYPLGSITVDGAGDCYESLANLAAGSSLATVTQWRKLGKVRYASPKHRIAVSGPSVNVPVNPAAKDINYTISVFNPLTKLYDTVVLAGLMHHTGNVTSQQIDLEKVPAGSYRININGVDNDVLLRPAYDWRNCIGLVEIWHHDAAVDPAFQLLDNITGNFKKPLFTIRLAAASVIWQFVARTAKVTSVYDKTSAIETEAGGPNRFRTKLPQRLSEIPYNQFRMEYQSNPMDPPKKLDEEPVLPMPGLLHWQKLNKNSTDYMVSETYLNY